MSLLERRIARVIAIVLSGVFMATNLGGFAPRAAALPTGGFQINAYGTLSGLCTGSTLAPGTFTIGDDGSYEMAAGDPVNGGFSVGHSADAGPLTGGVWGGVNICPGIVNLDPALSATVNSSSCNLPNGSLDVSVTSVGGQVLRFVSTQATCVNVPPSGGGGGGCPPGEVGVPPICVGGGGSCPRGQTGVPPFCATITDFIQGKLDGEFGCFFAKFPVTDAGNPGRFGCDNHHPGDKITGALHGLADGKPFQINCAPSCSMTIQGTHWEECQGAVPTVSHIRGYILITEWTTTVNPHGFNPPFEDAIVNLTFAADVTSTDGTLKTGQQAGGVDTVGFQHGNDPPYYTVQGFQGGLGDMGIAEGAPDSVLYACGAGQPLSIEALATLTEAA